MSGLFDKIFKSKDKDRKGKKAARPTSSAPASGATLPDNAPAASTSKTSRTPSSSSTSGVKKIPGRRKQKCLEWGVTALKFLKEISEGSELLSPLKAACGATTAILETIQAMDSNTEGWKGILETVRRHHQMFEEQLRLVNAENTPIDVTSALLSPIKAYAKELEGLLKELMRENDISDDNIPTESRLQGLKSFMKRYGTVKLEANRINDYGGRLDEAMKQFNMSMTIYMGFKLHSVGQELGEINAKLPPHPPERISNTEVLLKPRPSLVQNFVGRDDILEKMRKTHITGRSPDLNAPAITVLSGLGGSGKTQIALKFALEFEKYSDMPVFFLNADSEESLQEDYENLIRSLGNEYHSKSHKDALSWLTTKLKNWLLILDNADNPSLRLFTYIPKSPFGNVIITTRNANHATLAPNDAHPIEGLSEPDSVSLVVRSSGYENTETNRTLATEIVRKLGNLPLALTQAAGYVFVNQCLSTYLEIYRSSCIKILTSSSSQRPDDYPSSVARTIEMSMERLPTEAQDVLRIFVHLDSTSIPHAIIAKAAERQFEHVASTERSEFRPETLDNAKALRSAFCAGGEWSDFDFNELVTRCLQYSLLRITRQGDSKFYSMHILVQSYLKASSVLIQGQRPSQLIARLLGSSITIGKRYEFLPFNRLLIPHIRLIQLEDVVEAGDHHSFGRVLDETGNGNLALAHRERCVEMWRASLGEEHQNTLAALTSLASSYTAVGRFQEAVEVQEQVLAMDRKQLGAEHPNTMIDMHNLADSYRKLGQKEEAMGMEEQVLKLQQKVLGPEDPLTLATMNNLAASYAKLGRAQDALKLNELVLEMRRKVLGPEHPDTIKSMYNLALSYYHFGRFEEILELEEQVVELQTRVLGLEHPDTLSAIWNLACSLEDLGLEERRLDLLRIAVPAYEKVFGADHSDTIQLTSELKELLSELSQPADIALS